MSRLIDKNTGHIVKELKNLGWLLANWKKVESFTVAPHPTDDKGCVLTAHLYGYLSNHTDYQTEFASYEVCKQWLKRPVFIGVFLKDTIVDTEGLINKRHNYPS